MQTDSTLCCWTDHQQFLELQQSLNFWKHPISWKLNYDIEKAQYLKLFSYSQLSWNHSYSQNFSSADVWKEKENVLMWVRKYLVLQATAVTNTWR